MFRRELIPEELQVLCHPPELEWWSSLGEWRIDCRGMLTTSRLEEFFPGREELTYTLTHCKLFHDDISHF